MSASPTSTDGADLLLSVSGCQVLSVTAGVVERVAAGELQLLQKGDLIFLACGIAFGYPLVNQPVLRSEERVYILPAEAGKHFVIYVAADVTPASLQQFEEALAATTQLRTHGAAAAAGPEPASPVAAAGATTPTSPTPTTPSSAIVPAARGGAGATAVVPARPAAARSSTPTLTAAGVGSALSTAILFTGKAAATVLVTGADLAGRGVASTARGLKTVFKPSRAGTNVRPETIARLEKAKVVSRMAVTVSSGLVTGAAALAKSLGSALSDAVMSTELGDRIKKGGESDTAKAAKQVANSGLVAFAEVWDSLEKAALVFGEKAGPGVLDFAEHRFGADGAEVAKVSLSIAHNVTQSGLNMRNLGVGGMVRQTAAETAKHVLLSDGTTHGTMEITPQVASRPALAAAPAPALLMNGPVGGGGADAHAHTPVFAAPAPPVAAPRPAAAGAGARPAPVPVAAAPEEEFNAFA